MVEFAEERSECLVVQGEEVESYLAGMGISVPEIVDALAAGELAAGNTTSFAPPTAPGLRRWLSVVERAREGLTVTNGWTLEDKLNRPTSVSPGKKYSLAFVGGNEDTGVASGTPKAARKRGRATAEDYPESGTKIRYEAQVFSMFSAERGVSSGGVDTGVTPPLGAWILLYYRDEDELRWEISLPAAFSSQDKQFSGWRVRIIGPEVLKGELLQKDVRDIGGGDVDFEIA